MPRVRDLSAVAGALAAFLGLAGTACAAAPTFTVSYAGSGTNRTIVHSTPPNPGGNPDHDTADDSEAQAWSLRFEQALQIPSCTGPCHGASVLAGAQGRSTVVAKIDHLHVDGLYTDMNQSVSCTLRPKPPATSEPSAAIDISYNARSVTLTALDPIPLAVLLVPVDCPDQGDAMDGIADDYFGPGFSFDAGYGASRWFTAGPITIRRSRLAHSTKLSFRLGLTAAGTPPSDCGTTQPSYEHCATSGSWSGVLTLTANRP